MKLKLGTYATLDFSAKSNRIKEFFFANVAQLVEQLHGGSRFNAFSISKARPFPRQRRNESRITVKVLWDKTVALRLVRRARTTDKGPPPAERYSLAPQYI